MAGSKGSKSGSGSKGTISRSAISGRFVTKGYATSHKSTTVTEKK